MAVAVACSEWCCASSRRPYAEMCTRTRTLCPTWMWKRRLPSGRQPRAQCAISAWACRGRPRASRSVSVPLQPSGALMGHLSRISTSPRRVMVTDFVEIKTRAGWDVGREDVTDTVRLVRAVGPPLRLIVLPVKTCAVEVPAVSVSLTVTVY